MSKTLQVVRWSLGQTCTLRSPATLTDPVATIGAIFKAATYSKALASNRKDGFGVYGDICVTGANSNPFPPNFLPAPIPSRGFVVSRVLADIGGAAGLTELCRTCPANTASPRPAGCAGTLLLFPESEATEAQLRGIVRRLGITQAVADAFLPTTPLWYGLWARSPLTAGGRALIRAILAALRAEFGSDVTDGFAARRLPELDALIQAIDATDEHDLTLSVSLAEPGYSSFGDFVSLPHCPICKARADKRWAKPGRAPASHRCKVCSHSFEVGECPPATPFNDELINDLEAQLGPAAYAAFAKRYLVESGQTPVEADATLATLATLALQKADADVEMAKVRALDARRRRFMREVLYSGLHPEFDGPGQADDPFESVGWTHAQLDAGEFLELLRRCRRHDVAVVSMHHSSAGNSALNRHQFGGWLGLRIRHPTWLFAKWRRQGCNERFSATINVPAALASAYDSGRCPPQSNEPYSPRSPA